MIKFLSRFFSKDKQIKKFSTTDTDATEGSNSKSDLNPEIKQIVIKLNNQDKITNEELNKLIGFYFNKTPIEHHIYKLNKDFSNSMCFDINTVNTVINESNDVDNIVLTMKELTYNAELSISISIKDFHEFFNPVLIRPVITER